MAQFTWTGAVNDEYANAQNWNPTDGPPGFGDTVVITFGTVDGAPNQIFADNLIEIGSTTGLPATLVFDNDAATSLSNPTITGSTVGNAVPGQTTATQTALDANGPFVNQGTIVADGPAGSIFTIDVDQNGGNAGFFINQGEVEADAGNTLDIVVGPTSEILNAGLILANGGSILITTTGSNQIVGGYAPILGLTVAKNGGTVEFNAALPSGASGVRPYFSFADGDGDVLKLDQVAQFSGNILGFTAGDTIDIVGMTGLTIDNYNSLGVLTLSNGSGTISVDIAGPFDVNSFSAITSGGDTLIETTQTNDVWVTNSGTNLWTTGTNWSTGAPPSATGIAVLGNGNADTYNVSTGAGTVSVGSLILDDQNAMLEVANSLQVTPASYDSLVQQIAGTIQVDAEASALVYALREFTPGAVLNLENNSTLLVEGRASVGFTNDGTILTSLGNNNFGLSLDGTTTLGTDAVIDAGPDETAGPGGSILIGQDGAGDPATVSLQVDDSVTDTYSVLYSSPTSYGELTIDGNSTWTDAGDPTDTQNTRGYMVIGDIAEDGNTPLPPPAGTAQLTVENGSTLTEASYANIGSDAGSLGEATVTGDAHWNIGNIGTTGTPIGFLQVGREGTGMLTIADDAVVAVGAGGTIVSGGTTEALGFAVEIGHDAGSDGSATITSGGTLTALNALRIGDSGSGTMLVENSGFVSVDNNVDLGGNGENSDGGTGHLTLTSGGEIEQAASVALAIWAGSTVSLDALSAIDVGGSGTFIDGGIHVDGGSGLRGDGTVAASVDNDGGIHATNNGTYSLSTGGLLDITGDVTGSGDADITAGATLEIDGTIAASQAISFLAQNGLPETLILGSPGGGLSNAITNMQDLDRIELGGLAITGATFSAGTITVTTSGADYTLTDVSLNPDASTSFTHGHDSVSGDDYIQVTCFAAGSRIATPDGEVAVESLAVGQMVLTVLDGRPKPIVWVGRRRIDCRRHPRPHQVWPVRVAAGAFGPARPGRPLFLSPDHAVLVDGVLIPVKYLINGESVAQIPVDTVTYYHIELAAHDVVVAEGLPAESYLDIDDHATFGSGGSPLRLHPDLSPLIWEAKGCAPLVVTGPVLDAARARLRRVAAAPAHPLAA